MSSIIEREWVVILILTQVLMGFGILALMRWKQRRLVRVKYNDVGGVIELEAANPDDFKAMLQLVNGDVK